MSQNKKKAIERLRENSPGLDMWEHINLQRDAIDELADDLKEQKRVFDEHARLEKNFRQNTRNRIGHFDDRLPELVKPDPDEEWPRLTYYNDEFGIVDVGDESLTKKLDPARKERILKELVRCYRIIHGHKEAKDGE